MTKDLLDGPPLRELPKSPWTTRSNLHHRDGERGSSVNGDADVFVPILHSFKVDVSSDRAAQEDGFIEDI